MLEFLESDSSSSRKLRKPICRNLSTVKSLYENPITNVGDSRRGRSLRYVQTTDVLTIAYFGSHRETWSAYNPLEKSTYYDEVYKICYFRDSLYFVRFELIHAFIKGSPKALSAAPFDFFHFSVSCGQDH